jgi:hypothetical protein
MSRSLISCMESDNSPTCNSHYCAACDRVFHLSAKMKSHQRQSLRAHNKGDRENMYPRPCPSGPSSLMKRTSAIKMRGGSTPRMTPRQKTISAVVVPSITAPIALADAAPIAEQPMTFPSVGAISVDDMADLVFQSDSQPSTHATRDL